MAKWVLTLPEDQDIPESAVIRLRDEIEQELAHPGSRVIALPWGASLQPLGTPVEELIKRLDWLFSLTPGERVFVRALADNPSDTVSLQVFADWLKEQNREDDAKTILTVMEP